ncbi:MAG: hypothetical protein RJA35_948 [Actinomycetota bacterium]|jgi:hypothetical protein
MSAVANIKPSVSRPNFTLVSGIRAMTNRQANPRLAFIGMITLGLLSIALLNLVLNLVTSSGVYELAGLKAEKARLELSSQIVKQQVDSLSSNQNLASAAQAMGMIANANPVFLDVNSQKVYGAPAAASINAGDRVSGNLIANAEWTTKSHSSQIKAALSAEQAKATENVVVSNVATDNTATASQTKPTAATGTRVKAEQGYVGGAKSSIAPVGLGGGGIPAAPTH